MNSSFVSGLDGHYRLVLVPLKMHFLFGWYASVTPSCVVNATLCRWMREYLQFTLQDVIIEDEGEFLIRKIQGDHEPEYSSVKESRGSQ